MGKYCHRVWLLFPALSIDHHGRFRPVHKVTAFDSRHSAAPTMIGLRFRAHKLTIGLDPIARKGHIFFQLWHPHRVVVGIACQLAINLLRHRPVDTIGRETHSQTLKKSFVAAASVFLAVVPKDARAVHAAHHKIVALATFVLNQTQVGFFPSNAIPGLRITHAHLLLCVAFKGR